MSTAVHCTVVAPSGKSEPGKRLHDTDSRPEPVSVAVAGATPTFAPPGPVASAVWFADTVRAGALLSTLLPAIGPAVVQLPSWSQIARLLVSAFAVSVPSATLVVSEKLASDGSSRPKASDAVHAIVTSVPCHSPSTVPHVTVGGVLSSGSNNRGMAMSSVSAR